MDYTITIIRRDRTDVQPRTINATWRRMAFIVSFIIALPVAGFWISYLYIAPFQLGEDVETLRATTEEAENISDALQAQHDAIVEENENLRKGLRIERQQRAELEAKMTITENARQEAGDKMSSLEEEVLNLHQSIKFYEQFMKPANAQAPIQCFNIKAGMEGENLSYRVSFMKNDRKNKEKIKLNIAFRVLAGANAQVLDPQVANIGEPEHERTANFTLDTSVSGKFKPHKLPVGLRLLDIKGYDENNKVMAHCWKAF